MKDSTLLDFFNGHAEKLVITEQKIRDIVKFYVSFLQENDDHINFFLGNLVGVNRIYWTPRHREYFLEEICEILDYDEVCRQFGNIEGIEQHRHISGNPLNHIFIWLAYRVNTSNASKKAKHQAIMAILSTLQCKYLTSLHNRSFPYPANPAVAHAAFESLSMKSLMKRLGSWRAVIEYRSEHFISENEKIHYNVLEEYGNVIASTKVVNDIQNRVRKSLNGLTSAYFDILESQKRIVSSSTYRTVDGEKVLRDIKNNVSENRVKMRDIIGDKRDLIRPELVEVTLDIIPTSTEANLIKTLEFISESSKGKGRYNILDEIDGLVVYIYDYIRVNRFDADQITDIISRLRAVFRSHKTADRAVVDIKHKLDIIIPKAITAKHEATRSGTKVAVLIYLSIRLLSLNYYR